MSPNQIYCLTCKQRTDNNDLFMTMSTNDRLMQKSKCAECHGWKTRFVGMPKIGGGFDLQAEITRRYPGVEFHMRTIKNGKVVTHNFTGAGTQLHKRIKNHNQFIDDAIQSAGQPPTYKTVKSGLFRRKKRVKTNKHDDVLHIIENANLDHDDPRVLTKPVDTTDESAFRHDNRYELADRLCGNDKKCVKKAKRKADVMMVKETSKNTLKQAKKGNLVDAAQNALVTKIIGTKAVLGI